MSTSTELSEEAPRQSDEDSQAEREHPIFRKTPYGLTARELTVLELVVAGKTDKEIASELGISRLTVPKHVSNILGKMDAASRTEAGVRALREGFID